MFVSEADMETIQQLIETNNTNTDSFLKWKKGDATYAYCVEKFVSSKPKPPLPLFRIDQINLKITKTTELEQIFETPVKKFSRWSTNIGNKEPIPRLTGLVTFTTIPSWANKSHGKYEFKGVVFPWKFLNWHENGLEFGDLHSDNESIEDQSPPPQMDHNSTLEGNTETHKRKRPDETPQTSKRTKRCHFFPSGKCRRGDDCPFEHTLTQPKQNVTQNRSTPHPNITERKRGPRRGKKKPVTTMILNETQSTKEKPNTETQMNGDDPKPIAIDEKPNRETQMIVDDSKPSATNEKPNTRIDEPTKMNWDGLDERFEDVD